MTATDEVIRFADELGRTSDGVTTAVTRFPSGAVNLDVRCGDRMFVLAYFPSSGRFGVDEILEGDGIGTDFRFGFEDFRSAKTKLAAMLREATPIRDSA